VRQRRSEGVGQGRGKSETEEEREEVGQRRGESGKEDREGVRDNSHYDLIKSMNLFSFRGFS
jgi:hypothetical protein